jgi:hypothetical protein
MFAECSRGRALEADSDEDAETAVAARAFRHRALRLGDGVVRLLITYDMGVIAPGTPQPDENLRRVSIS